jgi:hypothetical protein
MEPGQVCVPVSNLDVATATRPTAARSSSSFSSMRAATHCQMSFWNGLTIIHMKLWMVETCTSGWLTTSAPNLLGGNLRV